MIGIGNLDKLLVSKLNSIKNSVSMICFFVEQFVWRIQNLVSKLNRSKSMIYGYCRVSTKGQLENNSLEQQELEIFQRYEHAMIIKEQFTGTKTNRPIFNELIGKLVAGDTIVVTRLDRLARNTVEGIQIVEKLFEIGVVVHVLNVGLLENTTMGKFFLTTLLACAEMERNNIIERTQLGKEIAKTKSGFREGRPKAASPKRMNEILNMIEAGQYSYKEASDLFKISKSTLYRAMRNRRSL